MDRNVFLCANIIRLEIASFGNDETLSETPSGSQSLSVVALSGRCKTKVRFENDMPRLHTKLSYSVIIQRCPSVRQPVWSELKVIPFLSSLITGPVHALSPQHVRTKPTQQRTSNQPSFQGNTRSGFIPSASLLRSSARLGNERSHAANLCHANPCLEPKIDLLYTHFGALLIAVLRDPQRLNNRRICFV